jgi:hypothetical protein
VVFDGAGTYFIQLKANLILSAEVKRIRNGFLWKKIIQASCDEMLL